MPERAYWACAVSAVAKELPAWYTSYGKPSGPGELGPVLNTTATAARQGGRGAGGTGQRRC
eukprot:12632609-Alexandrium_andersonii.AAC.1